MTDDYSNYPKSISEIKGDKTGLSEDNLPRDVLIDILRAIDSKEINPIDLVVVYSDIGNKGGRTFSWRIAGKDIAVHIGMLSHTIHRMIDTAKVMDD